MHSPCSRQADARRCLRGTAFPAGHCIGHLMQELTAPTHAIFITQRRAMPLSTWQSAVGSGNSHMTLPGVQAACSHGHSTQSRLACDVTPAGGGMNHTAVASPTEMARFFMLAPHVKPAAGSNKQGFWQAFFRAMRSEDSRTVFDGGLSARASALRVH